MAHIPAPRILVVGGAGAIATTLAFHLSSAGADVYQLVRPGRVESLQAAGGIDMQRVCLTDAMRTESRAPIERFRWGRGTILTEEQAAIAPPFDFALVTPSVPKLIASSDGAAMLQRLAAGSCHSATFVIIRVGPRNRDQVAEAAGLPTRQIVEVTMTAVAWSAPLPGETFSRLAPALRRPSQPHQPRPVAYWLPASIPVCGEPARAAAVARLLSASRVPAHVSSSLAVDSALNALIIPLLLLLELHGWSFRAVRHSGRVHRAISAGREAAAVVGRQAGSRWLGLATAAAAWVVVWGALVVAPLVTPFDLEAFFRAHFGGKMVAQTALLAEEAVEAGSAAGVQTRHLAALLAAARNQGSQAGDESTSGLGVGAALKTLKSGTAGTAEPLLASGT